MGNNPEQLCRDAGDVRARLAVDAAEENIIGYDALYNSMLKCRRGVGWKDSVAHFVLNAPEEIMRLEEELKEGTYRPRKPQHFAITHPKRREIASIPFRDRVYQRSLNDNVLYPAMTRSFIFDNWACQKGKGTDGARERLKEFLRRYYRKHGAVGWVAQFDVKGYYPNMSHRFVEELFRSKLPEGVFRRVLAVLRHQYEGEKGYNPGSQMIQIAGISALDYVDHYAKERLRVRYYIRYMDDFLMIHPDRGFLEECRERVREQLKRGEFELNEQKTRIYPLRIGIRFLGFDFRLTKTGKVVMLIDPRSVKAKRKNLRRLVSKSKRGEIPRASVDESYRSWRAHAAKGNSWKLLRRMDDYYESLWRG